MDKNFIEQSIHKVPNFPKPGILFYDITGILTDTQAFSSIIDYYCERYKDNKPDLIAAIDSRGFIFASPIAYALKIPLLLVRKFGKLPRNTIHQEFSLEYGTDRIELNPDDVPAGANVLLFDDLFATGGTAKAACILLEKQQAVIQEIAGIIALDFLPYKKTLEGYNLHYLVSYNTEKVANN